MSNGVINYIKYIDYFTICADEDLNWKKCSRVVSIHGDKNTVVFLFTKYKQFLSNNTWLINFDFDFLHF